MVLNNLSSHGRRHLKLFTNCHVSWDTLYVTRLLWKVVFIFKTGSTVKCAFTLLTFFVALNMITSEQNSNSYKLKFSGSKKKEVLLIFARELAKKGTVVNRTCHSVNKGLIEIISKFMFQFCFRWIWWWLTFKFQ